MFYAIFLRRDLSPRQPPYSLIRGFLSGYSISAQRNASFSLPLSFSQATLEKVYENLPHFLTKIKPESALLVVRQILSLYIDARSLRPNYSTVSVLGAQWQLTMFGYHKEEKIQTAKALLAAVNRAIAGETFVWPTDEHLPRLKNGHLSTLSDALSNVTKIPFPARWYP